MIIELYRPWVPEHMHADACGVCGHAIAPRSVIASAATDEPWWDMGVACPACIEYLGRRNPAKSPTIEFYREMLGKYPRPMYESDEDLEAAGEAAGYEDPEEMAYEASWVWRAARDEDELVIIPTVLYRMDQDKQAAAIVEKPEKGRALIIFRSPEEAEKYRGATGKHPAVEGWGPVALELEDLANVLKMHECTHVAMPEPWTGKGNVDFFAASDFIGMLHENAPA